MTVEDVVRASATADPWPPGIWWWYGDDDDDDDDAIIYTPHITVIYTGLKPQARWRVIGSTTNQKNTQTARILFAT